MKKMRKAVAAVMILCLCLAGCSTRDEKQEKDLNLVRERIVLWTYYETADQKESLDELTRGFNESQDKYHLTWEYQGPVTEFNKKIAIGITQNQLPDMVIIDNPDMRKYVDQGTFEDLTDEISDMEYLDKYYPNVLSSVIYDGKYYGLPFCCNNAALIYNPDILKAEGVQVPKSWEEFLECAMKLTNEERKGFAMSAIEGEQGVFQVLPFILSAGDDIDSVGGKGTEEAFTLMKQLVDSGAMSKDCINWSQNDVARKFIDGECAMMQNGPWVLPALDKSGVSYEIATLPYELRSVAVAGGENVGVLKGKNVDGAIAFMEYYNSGRIMLEANLKANSLPPRKDMAEQMAQERTEYEIFEKQMGQCISRSAYEQWPQITRLLSDAQFRIITGQISPLEACQEIQNKENKKKEDSSTGER